MPDVRLNEPGALFDIIRILAPVVMFPWVIVRVPETVTFPVNVTPDELLTVRLFRFATLEGIWTPAEDPPKTRLEDDDVVRFVGVPAIVGPFSVRVFAPTVKAPEVRVKSSTNSNITAQ